METTIIDIASWIAVGILSLSFWFQIWKIHIHKEVRDISILFYGLLLAGYLILTYTAYLEKSSIFLTKQITSVIPVIIIVCQVYYHRKDSWHDPSDPNCKKCKLELEPRWKYCPKCGHLHNNNNN